MSDTNSAIPVTSPWLTVFPELAAIRDKAWVEVLNNAAEVTIPDGATAVRRGEPCQNFFLVITGTLRIFESADSDREILLYRTSGGEPCILTLSGLLSGNNYVAEARADGEVRAIAIPAELFRHAMNSSPEFRNFIMATMARRLNDVMRVVEQVTFQHLDRRLACLLEQLFQRNKSQPISATHDDLARELGTKRVVVTRILRDLERAGCIRLGWRRIELVSPEALALQMHGRDQ